MLDTGGSASGARVWKPWVPTANARSSSQAPPSLIFEPAQPTDQTSADATSPRLPGADGAMSAHAASHRLPAAEDDVSLALAGSPTSSFVDPAGRSPVMMSGASSGPDSEALYELPGLMASGSDSQPAPAAQPATVTARHAPAGAAAVSNTAAEAAVEPPITQALAGQGNVPTAAGLGPSSMGASTYQAVRSSGTGQTGTFAGAGLDPAPVGGEAAAGQTVTPAGARLNPVPVAGEAAAGQVAAPAAGSLQPGPVASAAAERGEGVSGGPSTSQAPMDARQMQLPAKFASGEAAGGLRHAHAQCT